MFAIASFALALLGYVLDGVHAQTNAWFSPLALGLLSLAALALHVISPLWPRR
jgi:hypothetical protein